MHVDLNSKCCGVGIYEEAGGGIELAAFNEQVCRVTKRSGADLGSYVL